MRQAGGLSKVLVFTQQEREGKGRETIKRQEQVRDRRRVYEE
jgi:hypothetical protein